MPSFLHFWLKLKSMRPPCKDVRILLSKRKRFKEPTPKIWNKYSQKRNCAARFPHSCVCERFIYSQDRSAYAAAGPGNMWTEPGNRYINPSQTHECGNWDWGCAIPRIEYINGIFVAVNDCILKMNIKSDQDSELRRKKRWGKNSLLVLEPAQ